VDPRASLDDMEKSEFLTLPGLELSPWYPLDRRLGGPQSQSGRRGEEGILDPTGTRTPTSQSSSP
jgi:hypothetical protein